MIGWIIEGILIILLIAMAVMAALQDKIIFINEFIDVWLDEFLRTFKFIVLLIILFPIMGYCIDSSKATQREYKWKIEQTHEIVATKTNDSYNGQMNGNLFHIYATLTQNHEYVVTVKTKDKGYKKTRIDENRTTIYETNEECCLKKYKQTYKTIRNANNMKCFYPFWKKEKIKIIDEGHTNKIKYKLYIPEGSLIGEYRVN